MFRQFLCNFDFYIFPQILKIYFQAKQRTYFLLFRSKFRVAKLSNLSYMYKINGIHILFFPLLPFQITEKTISFMWKEELQQRRCNGDATPLRTYLFPTNKISSLGFLFRLLLLGCFFALLVYSYLDPSISKKIIVSCSLFSNLYSSYLCILLFSLPPLIYNRFG